MNKLATHRLLSGKRSTTIVGSAFALLLAVNIFPFNYATTRNCPSNGTYTETGRSMGVPFSYFKTIKGSITDCAGFFGDVPTRSSSAQALIGDAFVFGLLMIGVNVLVDTRRLKV